MQTSSTHRTLATGARTAVGKLAVALAAVGAVIAFAPAANAAGCLKGAAVGGVAGHVAGKHGVVGAAAGCAIEHHRESKKTKDAAKAQSAQPAATPQQPAGTTS